MLYYSSDKLNVRDRLLSFELLIELLIRALKERVSSLEILFELMYIKLFCLKLRTYYIISGTVKFWLNFIVINPLFVIYILLKYIGIEELPFILLLPICLNLLLL